MRIDHASVSLGGRAVLTNVTAHFPAGAITALVGGDGAGKTTLLRVLSGRVRATGSSGAALAPPAEGQSIGYQGPASGTWPTLSVQENLRFAGRAHGLTDPELERHCTELMRTGELTEARNRPASRLSGGMRQKLGFFMAGIGSPDILLLDEPTTGVDPHSRGELWGLIGAAAADGATVVLATTYLDEAESADRVMLLTGGTILAEGSPGEVIAASPGHLLTPATSGTRVAADFTWRRGRDVLGWSAGPVPAGWRKAEADLESAAIAFQCATPSARATPPETANQPNDHPERKNSDTPLVSARQISHSFGRIHALESVSLTAQAGSVIGLVGGNGAGKTTLIRIILGLEQPTDGEVKLFGGADRLAAHRRIGYVSQAGGLYPQLSARENLSFATGVYGGPDLGPAADYAAALGPAPVGSLGRGTQRMLGFLIACAHDPDLLILDEPTSGMDPRGRAELWTAIAERAQAGTGIIVSTHYMAEAEQCDQLCLLRDGRMAGWGSPAEILAGAISIGVTCSDPRSAQQRLRRAGLAVGRRGDMLRVSGTDADEVREVLDNIGVEVSVVPATLAEMMRG